MDKYWEDIEYQPQGITFPKGFVLHRSIETILPYYIRAAVDDQAEEIEKNLREELEQNHVIGFQDDNDVLQLLAETGTDMEYLMSFLGNLLGELNGGDAELCESLVLAAFKLATEIREVS